MFSANLNCSMNNYFFLAFSGPEKIFLSYPCTIVFCVVEMNKELGWVMTAVPLKSFQWCVAQVDFSLVSSHYLHNSGACVPNKLDYYAATPSFLRNPDLFTADPTLTKILGWNYSENIWYNFLSDCERIFFYAVCSKLMSYSKLKLKSQK